jgi:hypothetical protein
MATRYFQERSSTLATSTVDDRHGESDGPGARVAGWMHKAICGLHGHDSLLQFEKDRIYLKCASCGHESPGWKISEVPASGSVQTEPATRRTLVGPRVIGTRRIA